MTHWTKTPPKKDGDYQVIRGEEREIVWVVPNPFSGKLTITFHGDANIFSVEEAGIDWWWSEPVKLHGRPV